MACDWPKVTAVSSRIVVYTGALSATSDYVIGA